MFDLETSGKIRNRAFLLQNAYEALRMSCKMTSKTRMEKIAHTLGFLSSAYNGFRRISGEREGLTSEELNELNDSLLITEALNRVNPQYTFSLQMDKINQAIKYLEQYNSNRLDRDDLKSATMLIHEFSCGMNRYSHDYSNRGDTDD